ncbi:MAG: hypothetical protein MJ227_01455 [Bacilli bacterium]|nr:hypothetical protein [Bacilli bacterium]
MKKIKDLPSTVFMIIGFVLAALSVLMMFAPALKIGGNNLNAVQLFWNEPLEGVRNRMLDDINNLNVQNGAILSFVGYMLIVLGAVIMGVMALPFVQPSARGEKIVLGLAGLSLLAGMIMVFTIGNQFYSVNPDLARFGISVTLEGGTVVAGIFAILAFGCDAFAMYLDW